MTRPALRRPSSVGGYGRAAVGRAVVGEHGGQRGGTFAKGGRLLAAPARRGGRAAVGRAVVGEHGGHRGGTFAKGGRLLAAPRVRAAAPRDLVALAGVGSTHRSKSWVATVTSCGSPWPAGESSSRAYVTCELAVDEIYRRSEIR